MSRHQFERYVRAFAILRTDPFRGEHRVKVVKVLLDQAAADAEVERLNRVNGPKGASYEWQVTHVFGIGPADPESDGGDEMISGERSELT